MSFPFPVNLCFKVVKLYHPSWFCQTTESHQRCPHYAPLKVGSTLLLGGEVATLLVWVDIQSLSKVWYCYV